MTRAAGVSGHEYRYLQLSRDLVRFLRAIGRLKYTCVSLSVCECVCVGPGDMLDSVTRETVTPVSAHFPKTPHAPPTPPSVGTTPSLPVPDLDRSAISVAQDHLSSGGVPATVSLSGDYKDASGKVIRRYGESVY